jgi:hypothetical protein
LNCSFGELALTTPAPRSNFEYTATIGPVVEWQTRTMHAMKYTRELLQNVVRECFSVAPVLRKLGLVQAGGTHSNLSRRIKELGIDTSHFLGKAANQGPCHKGSTKVPWQDTLVLRSNGRRQKAHRLRRALLEMGREYRCRGDGCSLSDNWLGRGLVLHVNHKNGNWLDDRPDNLDFLCPNCHSQTDNYCGSKGFAELTGVAKREREYRKRKKGPVAE